MSRIHSGSKFPKCVMMEVLCRNICNRVCHMNAVLAKRLVREFHHPNDGDA